MTFWINIDHTYKMPLSFYETLVFVNNTWCYVMKFVSVLMEICTKMDCCVA
jgi:hypothetical protein